MTQLTKAEHQGVSSEGKLPTVRKYARTRGLFCLAPLDACWPSSDLAMLIHVASIDDLLSGIKIKPDRPSQPGHTCINDSEMPQLASLVTHGFFPPGRPLRWLTWRSVR